MSDTQAEPQPAPPEHSIKEPFMFRGAALLPVEASGCRRCVGSRNDNELCGEMPDCAWNGETVQWVPDTPENRVEFIKWRMK
jgi:hypothetical protein